MDYIENFYNNICDEEARLESKHGQVEFLTTMRYIEKYLQPGARVLEIGAGTGRYSRAIASMGYMVEAAELVSHNIEIFKSQVQPAQNITITQGNALDLSAFEDCIFDITLVLGPMYHLYTVPDKQQAISEALRVTKSGGVVLVAYCISDGSLLENISSGDTFFSNYIASGKINPITFETTSVPEDIFELVRKENIDSLMASFNVERLHYVATDLITRFIRESIADMNDELFNLYLKYHFVLCERPDMVGVTHHSLDVFRKL